MCSSPLSTMASGHGSPYFSNRCFSRLPPFTPMRMAQPWSLAALITSCTRSGLPMFPGLMRKHAAPACAERNRHLVVKMDVSNDRHRAFAADFLHRGGTVRIRNRDAHDVLRRRRRSARSVRSLLWRPSSACSSWSGTLIGASPPTATGPTWIWRLLRRSMFARDECGSCQAPSVTVLLSEISPTRRAVEGACGHSRRSHRRVTGT